MRGVDWQWEDQDGEGGREGGRDGGGRREGEGREEGDGEERKEEERREEGGGEGGSLVSRRNTRRIPSGDYGQHSVDVAGMLAAPIRLQYSHNSYV